MRLVTEVHPARWTQETLRTTPKPSSIRRISTAKTNATMTGQKQSTIAVTIIDTGAVIALSRY